MEFKETKKKNLAFWNKFGRHLKKGGKVLIAVLPLAVTILSKGKFKMK